MERATKKTLLVGLDAACWEYLNPLLGCGRLPTLQRLIDDGIWGTLRSTMPPWTPTAWSSIVTGKNPGKHGIFDMLYRQPGAYAFTPTNATFRVGTPFWNRLNERGVRVGLVNVPFTYPIQEVDGFVIAGFGAPNSATDVAYPRDALQQHVTAFGPYRPVVDTELLRSAAPELILDTESKHQSKQVQIALELAQRYQVDVLAINLMLPDHANHKMPEMHQVEEAYCRSDHNLAQLIDTFRPDNVMLISDHGSSRLKGDFLLNRWLQDEGYCVRALNTPAERSLALNWILVQWLQKYAGLFGAREKFLRSMLRTLLPVLPGSIQGQFWNRVEEAIPYARDHVEWSADLDHSRSMVFPGSVYAGLLYFNVIGREPDGIVAPDERKALAAEIAEKLSGVRDPDGQPLITHVVQPEELYSGPALEYAPDLIVDCYDACWNMRTAHTVPIHQEIRNNYFIDAAHRREYGWHSREGIFVFSGPDFSSGLASTGGHVMDIPATLLHLYRVPVPEDYDGQVLVEHLAPQSRHEPLQTQAGDSAWDKQDLHGVAYETEQTNELIEHLKALGYLD